MVNVLVLGWPYALFIKFFLLHLQYVNKVL